MQNILMILKQSSTNCNSFLNKLWPGTQFLWYSPTTMFKEKQVKHHFYSKDGDIVYFVHTALSAVSHNTAHFQIKTNDFHFVGSGVQQYTIISS